MIVNLKLRAQCLVRWWLARVTSMGLFAAATILPAIPALAWDQSRLSVPVMVNDLIIPYPVFAIFVMPQSTLRAGFVDAVGGSTLTLAGRELPDDRTDFQASKTPGLEILEIRNNVSGEIARIHVFTMVPASRVDRDGYLNGYRIGSYPNKPLRGLAIYSPPEGYVELTAENANTAVSPNFTLGEFVSRQKSDYPKYLVLRPSLLLKLENILARLNHAGHPTGGFVIMSGYRTPYYNHTIGNVRYSRHVYGGAADFYIDEAPVDGRMDDLNKDGQVDRSDARWLANFVNTLSHRGC